MRTNGRSAVHDELTLQEIPRLWAALQQTYLLTFRYLESVTGRFGLSYPQAAVLVVLHHHEKPLPLSRVARLLTQEAQSTTELADRLERRGYVRRIRDQRDRRLVLLELTNEGRTMVDQILPAIREAGKELFDVLEPAQVQKLSALLLLVRDRAADRLGVDRERLRGLFDPDAPSCS